jgi:hypothetical protein
VKFTVAEPGERDVGRDLVCADIGYRQRVVASRDIGEAVVAIAVGSGGAAEFLNGDDGALQRRFAGRVGHLTGDDVGGSHLDKPGGGNPERE